MKPGNRPIAIYQGTDWARVFRLAGATGTVPIVLAEAA